MNRINKKRKGVLSVFLSSTFRDLKDERAELLKQIGKAFEAVGMEVFIPTGEPSQKRALDELLKCDVVIFLISPYYGSNVELCVYKDSCKADCDMKTGKEKISYTWCEYRFSLAEKKPHMCYIIDETWPSRDGSPNLWKFRDEIESIEYCPRIKRDNESIQKVVEDLVSNVIKWYSEKKINLGNFVGRREELKDLFEKVGSGRCTEVSGVGGIGKTTLCELVLSLYKIFGKKIIYTGIEGTYSSGTGYEWASKILAPKHFRYLSIDDLIDCLVLPSEMKKENTESKINLILSKLNSKGIILFIDNIKADEIDESLKKLIRKGNNALRNGSILFTSKKETRLAYYRLPLDVIEENERDRLVEIIACRLGKKLNQEDAVKIGEVGEGHPVATYLLVSNLERVGISNLENFKQGLDFASDEDVQEYILRVFETSLSQDAYDFVKNISVITMFEPVDFQILNKILDKKVWGEAIDAKIMKLENDKLLWALDQFQDVIFEDVPENYCLALRYYQEKLKKEGKIEDEIKFLFCKCKTNYEENIYIRFRNLYSLIEPIEHTYELLPMLINEIIKNLEKKERAYAFFLLGDVYNKLSNYKETAENRKKAIKAYKEALKVITFERFPVQYAMIQNNLGIAYGTLAEVEDTVENCEKAIKAYNEALKVYTHNFFPMDYAMTQNNLGTAYRKLAEVKDTVENCEKAIKAFNEALKVYTPDRFPIDYAKTQNNLGTTYGTLAEVEDTVENCEKAIKAYNEALKVYTHNFFPMDYAMTQNNLGTAYRKLAEVKDTVENCEKAIKAFNEALKVYTPDRFPIDYAKTQNNLGTTYGTLAEVEDTVENCEKAIKAYNEALKVYTHNFFPMDYAMTQNNLGTAYRKLAEVKDTVENCEKAIKAYNEALKFYIPDRFPMLYAKTQNNIGAAYRTLAEVKDTAENCKKAIKAFNETLKVYIPNRFPIDYAMTQNNLGTAYNKLAEVEGKAENCENAIKAYNEALKVFTKEEFPEIYPLVVENLKNLLRFCRGDK
ncbi:MAG: tetratricopeptide repeat protein [Candidatus Marinimicrobia bacterium]|nr:tetratricopeptide repeat protein [Candidatus Neomarinimicrobiota bacterium]